MNNVEILKCIVTAFVTISIYLVVLTIADCIGEIIFDNVTKVIDEDLENNDNNKED